MLKQKRKRRRERINTALIIAGIIVVVGLVAGAFAWISSPREGLKVPDLVGLSYEQARKKVEAAGLEIEVDADQDESVADLDTHKVVEQDPKKDSGAENGDMVTVRLKGLTDAQAMLDDVQGSQPVNAGGQTQAGQQSAPAQQQPGQASAQAPGNGRSVCLDPGHSVESPASEIDPASGLDVADNSGEDGEIEAMWELAQKTKQQLEQMGYTVRLTKASANSYASLRTRADIGNTCSVIVRLHYDPALQALLYPSEGQYKQHGDSVVYVDPGVAQGSAELAQAMSPHLKEVGIGRKMNDTGGTSNNTGPAYVGSVLSRVPVVLIENDPSMVSDNPGGQDQVAGAIARGVNAYFQSR